MATDIYKSPPTFMATKARKTTFERKVVFEPKAEKTIESENLSNEIQQTIKQQNV